MKKISLISILFLSYFLASAQTVSEADQKILNNIKQANAKITSMTSNFKQIKHLSILGEDMESEGVLNYSKPDKLALSYTDPEGDAMLINGDKFVMIASGKRNETTAKANVKMQGMKTILSGCLEGDLTKIGASKITCKETAKGYAITAEIDQKINKSGITKVVVTYDKADMSPVTLQTYEADDYTTYVLTNKVFNKTISADVFDANKNR